jgi:hypothetical protein
MASVDGTKHIIFPGGEKVGATNPGGFQNGDFGCLQNARSGPECAARIGVYETPERWVVLGVVEAARSLGGQLFFLLS